MSDALYGSQTVNKRLYWLLTIEWAGYTIRIASDEVDVVTEAGTSYAFAPGLDDVEVSESIELLADSAGQLSIPLEFLLPPGVSVAERISIGDDFSAARGELARWIEGTKWEERRVVLVGRLTDPEYGADDEPISTSLEEVLTEDRAIIPSSSQAVSETTWPNVDSLSDAWPGSVYPIVIGKPGAVTADLSANLACSASPGVWADFRADFHTASPGNWPDMYSGLLLVIAGHHVEATRVLLNNDEHTAADTRFVVINNYDQLGNPVAVVPFYATTTATDPYEWDGTADYDSDILDSDGNRSFGLGATSIDIDASFNDADKQLPIFVSWRDTLTEGGGLMLGGKLVREAGDVLEYLFGLSTIAVDRGRLAAAKPQLAPFLLDGTISTRVSPWEVLRDQILPILPVSIVTGPEGLYPVVWRMNASTADATVRIDADANPAIERVGRVRYDAEDRANLISVKYAYSYRTKAYLAQVTFGAAEDHAADDSIIVHPLCEWSRARTGQVLDRVIETAWVYDRATAYAVAEWIAVSTALPQRSVEYRVPEVDYLHVERGEVATLTDADLYLTDALCLVREVRTDGSGYLTLTLALVERPLQ